MDEGLLDRLLRGEHVSAEERLRLGAWPHTPLNFSELLRKVAALIDSESSFPRPWVPHEPGKVVREGGVITREGPNRYVYRAQRAHPINPGLLADKTEKVFDSAEAAAASTWLCNSCGDRTATATQSEQRC